MCDKSNMEAFNKVQPVCEFEIADVQSEETKAEMQNCVHFGQALAALGDELNLRYLHLGLVELVFQQSKKNFNMAQNNSSS